MISIMKYFKIVALLYMLVALFVAAAHAQNIDINSDVEPGIGMVRVGVYVHPPFVIKEGGHYSGMAIELWEWLAEQHNLTSDYIEYNNIGALVDAIVSDRVDAGVTNITVTKERAEQIDFTHSWYDAGLRVMVYEDGSSGFVKVFRGLQDSGHLKAYAWLLGIIILATILVTLFDRRFDKNFPERWRDGYAESFYTVMSVVTSGKPPARKNLFGWIGRIWQACWLVCGIALLAYVTSSVTSVMTTLSLTGQINSVADLPRHLVGVQTGSIAERFAKENGLVHLKFDHIEEAVGALKESEIDAIIEDAPVLEYYVHKHPEESLKVVGPIFEPDKYAFALEYHSQYTRDLTVDVIGAYEDGVIEELRLKYFGNGF